jgi:hypothetical protein
MYTSGTGRTLKTRFQGSAAGLTALLISVVLAAVLALSGCTQSENLEGGILVTFDVVGEEYGIFITNEETIADVLAVQNGQSQATIPSGLIVDGALSYKPWSWHIDSEDIHMAEFTIELRDGTPSQVEENLDYWLDSVKRFCPWGAEIVEIKDYR